MRYILTLLMLSLFIVINSGFCGYIEGESPPFPTTNGQVYHVAKTGNDSNDGSSLETAWLTMKHAINRYKNRTSEGLGGMIIIHAGRYSARFQIPGDSHWTSGGAEDKRLFIVGAGDGEVIFYGGCVADEWAKNTGDIYSTGLINQRGQIPSGVTAVVVNDDMYGYKPVNSLAELSESGDWYYDKELQVLFLYTYPGLGDPTHSDIVIVEDRGSSSSDFIIAVQDTASYVTIQDVTVEGGASHGIVFGQRHGSDYGNLIHCKVQYCSKAGVDFLGSDYVISRDNLIQGNIIRNWPRGNWNSNCGYINAGGWPSAISGGQHHLCTGNTVINNHGEGVGFARYAGHNEVSYNIVANNWSVGIYLDNNKGNRIFGNHVYVDYDFTIADVGFHCSVGDEVDRVLRRSRQIGIATGDEEYNNRGAESSDNAIYNNLIVNCSTGITHYSEAAGSGLRRAQVFNNTIIMPESEGNFRGISYRGSEFDEHSFISNNIIVSRTSNGLLIRMSNAVTDNITYNHNFYYSPLNDKPFMHGNNTYYSIEEWKAQTGWGLESNYEDPQLDSEYKPSEGSPALFGGWVLDTPFDRDFNDVSRPQGEGWGRGAFETPGNYIPPVEDPVDPPSENINISVADYDVLQNDIDILSVEIERIKQLLGSLRKGEDN